MKSHSPSSPLFQLASGRNIESRPVAEDFGWSIRISAHKKKLRVRSATPVQENELSSVAIHDKRILGASSLLQFLRRNPLFRSVARPIAVLLSKFLAGPPNPRIIFACCLVLDASQFAPDHFMAAVPGVANCALDRRFR